MPHLEDNLEQQTKYVIISPREYLNLQRPTKTGNRVKRSQKIEVNNEIRSMGATGSNFSSGGRRGNKVMESIVSAGQVILNNYDSSLEYQLEERKSIEKAVDGQLNQLRADTSNMSSVINIQQKPKLALEPNQQSLLEVPNSTKQKMTQFNNLRYSLKTAQTIYGKGSGPRTNSKNRKATTNIKIAPHILAASAEMKTTSKNTSTYRNTSNGKKPF